MYWEFPWTIRFSYRKRFDYIKEGFLELEGWGWHRHGIAFTNHAYPELFKVMKVWKIGKWYIWYFNNKPYNFTVDQVRSYPDGEPLQLDLLKVRTPYVSN